MGFIKTYPLSTTINGIVNPEKLNFELKTSTIHEAAVAKQFGNEVQVRFEVESISEEDIATLTYIVSNHDGETAEVTQTKVDNRDLGIRTLVQMAIYHPVLDNDETNSYLTHIDNYINAFVRSGNFNNIIAKIQVDAFDTEGEFYTYLNQIINTSGNKTFEYFISSIMNI